MAEEEEDIEDGDNGSCTGKTCLRETGGAQTIFNIRCNSAKEALSSIFTRKQTRISSMYSSGQGWPSGIVYAPFKTDNVESPSTCDSNGVFEKYIV